MTPTHLQIFDATIIAMIINIINTITNVVWSLRIKSAQGDSQIFKTLKDANEEKDVLIKELKEDLTDTRSERNRYRNQYNSLIIKFKHQEGELKTYKGMNNKVVEASDPIK